MFLCCYILNLECVDYIYGIINNIIYLPVAATRIYIRLDYY